MSNYHHPIQHLIIFGLDAMILNTLSFSWGFFTPDQIFFKCYL